jgi:aminomethyltransferase
VADTTADAPLKTTPLAEAHRAAGARMVPFAGYEMPLQYTGIIAEHRATRESAGLFDVSHMGQIRVAGRRPGAAAAWLERLTPSDIAGLPPGEARYTVLPNDAGGCVDDLILTRIGDHFRIVVNGARREAVAAHLAAHPDADVEWAFLDRALIALQGPLAETVLSPHVDASLVDLPFMSAVESVAFGVPALVSRTGYTGEDGFEVSLLNDAAGPAWRTLLSDGRVSPVGLGARDTLRLEAGLCLYGQDLDETISPIEAGLAWIVGKRRREDGGFIGEQRIRSEIVNEPARRRVGLAVEGRVPVRHGAPVRAAGREVGVVTSGGVGPTVGAPIAFGLVEAASAAPGARLEAIVRDKAVPVTVVKLPFLPAKTKRKAS